MRFDQDHADEAALWDELTALPVTAPLPEQLPHLFYGRLGSLLRCGLYADRVEPFLQHFPRENMMFVSFAGVQTQLCICLRLWEAEHRSMVSPSRLHGCAQSLYGARSKCLTRSTHSSAWTEPSIARCQPACRCIRPAAPLARVPVPRPSASSTTAICLECRVSTEGVPCTQP